MEWSNLKLDLVQLLLNTNDKQLLDQVKKLLDPQEGYVVPEAHKQIVRERRAKYVDGLPSGKTFDQIETEIRNRK